MPDVHYHDLRASAPEERHDATHSNKDAVVLRATVVGHVVCARRFHRRTRADGAWQGLAQHRPATGDGFGGRVTLVEFWTYGCWNCRNVEPYVKQWHRDYAPRGLAVVAVHTPELESEYDVDKVAAYLKKHAITYPAVIDNDFGNWNRYANRYWPALYLIDKRGVLRYTRIGEGGYVETERQIAALLAEPDAR